VPLLSSPVQLHDVKDVEKFASRALDRRLQTMGARLDEHRYEDALTYLIGVAFELSLHYNPELNTSFSKYLHNTLPNRVIDWYRRTFGDTRAPKPPLPLSYDRAVDEFEDDDGARVDLARIEAALARSGRYCPIPGHADGVGLLTG
jgi:hypothetical protein